MAIQRLTDNIVNQIAAGEVVERPASVVRELLDNAIDAGATRISIVTAGGGKNLIRITDNGSGMSKDDLARSIDSNSYVGIFQPLGFVEVGRLRVWLHAACDCVLL